MRSDYELDWAKANPVLAGLSSDLFNDRFAAEKIEILFRPINSNQPGDRISSFLPRRNQRQQPLPARVETSAIPRRAFRIEDYKDKIDPQKFEILSRLLGSVSIGLTREEVEEEYDLREE